MKEIAKKVFDKFMKTSIKTKLKMLVALVVVVLITKCSFAVQKAHEVQQAKEKAAKELHAANVQVSKLMLDTAMTHLNKGDFGEARAYAYKVKENPHAKGAKKILSDLNQLAGKDKLNTAIGKLTNVEYTKLKRDKTPLVKTNFKIVGEAITDYAVNIKHQLRKKLRNEHLKAVRIAKQKKAAAERERKRKAAKAKKEKIQAERDARVLYGALLRNNYLDQGMDIKVYIRGTNKDRLVLSYILINDVWFHQFGKGTLINEIRDMGFNKITMTDGSSYRRYSRSWTFN